MQRVPDPNSKVFNDYNAHPPSSILMVLPLGRLDYTQAFFTWSLLSLLFLVLSLLIVLRQFPQAVSVWSILPLAALLLWCNSFRQQMIQGQLNLVLLLLLTATWAADRSGRPYLAGGLLGMATAIKLFPGYVFLYFLARRQWRSVIAGIVSFVVLTGITVALLGWASFHDYVTIVLPSLEKYRVSWMNLSFAGFWHKLFNSEGSRVIPLWQAPPLAWTATVISDGILTAFVAWLVWRSRTLRELDLAFSMTIVAMLLASPICWDHYFTLLFLPLYLLWVWTSGAASGRAAFWLILIGLWLGTLFYWRLGFREVTHRNWPSLTATPWQALTVLSIQTYMLLALFLFTILVFRRSPDANTAEEALNEAPPLRFD